MFDPWSFWTYEQNIVTMGHSFDGRVLKYEVTGDEQALTRAREVWRTCSDVDDQSRVYGGQTACLADTVKRPAA